MKNTNTNNTKTYYYPPRTPEEFFDAINLEKGDEGYNLEILNSWSWEQKMQYYRECASRYEEDRRSPWEVVLESCCKRLLGATVYEVFYQLSSDMAPVAVVATKRKKNGAIDPRTIKAIVHYTPCDIEEGHIAELNEYSEFVEKAYGIHPRLVMVGKEFDNDVFRAVMYYGRDVSVFANKKD